MVLQYACFEWFFNTRTADKNQGNEEAHALFQQISVAYNVLSDPAKRKYYDKTGSIEGIDVSAEDFMSSFYSMMHELMGGMSIHVRLPACSLGLRTQWRNCVCYWSFCCG